MRTINDLLQGLILSIFLVSPALAEVQITRQPVSEEVPLGQPASFTVEAAAASGETILYQWYFNGNAISGATIGTLTIASVQTTNLGTYFAKVGNLQSSKESAHVELTATQGIISEIYPAVEVVFPTVPGKTYVMQSSVDLVNWTTLGNPITADEPSTAVLLSSRGRSHSYYRVFQRLSSSVPLTSLNGLTLTFKPATPATARQFSLAFTGATGAQSGNYVASSGLIDAGTYTYAPSGATATLVVSTSNGGPSASYNLDFSQATYVKSQFGNVVETGSFSY